MIKKVAAGIYTYLPFGWRSLAEADGRSCAARWTRAGADRAAHAGHPAGRAVEESGRWQKYGKELLRIKDRHERDFVLRPDARGGHHRHRAPRRQELPPAPFNLYQIQTKFRDEIRPRFGLMRGREFLMKDAYSFHADAGEPRRGLRGDARTPTARIFEACELDYIVVEADTGTIGGSASHEFMVLAETGESAVVRCPDCGYARERREGRRPGVPRRRGRRPRAAEAIARGAHARARRRSTTSARFLGIAPTRSSSRRWSTRPSKGCVAVLDPRRPRGQRGQAREPPRRPAPGAGERGARCARRPARRSASPARSGCRRACALVADQSVRDLADFVCGANKARRPLRSASTGAATPEPRAAATSLLVGGGDPCPRCDGTLEIFRGIEVGHIFKLGTKYSEAMQLQLHRRGRRRARR